MVNSQKQTFSARVKSTFKADCKRAFKTPLVYIMTAICFVMPILILVMTSLMPETSIDANGVETVNEKFTNVWQTLGELPKVLRTSPEQESGMSLLGMCNVNLLFFAVTTFVCIFTCADFKSGYVKNFFSVRAEKSDYVFSKSLLAFIVASLFFIAYFIGALIGGAISKLSFSTTGFGIMGVICCFLSKIFLTAIFSSISLLISVAVKNRLWLSLLMSIGAGALLFATIPLITPLTSTVINVILCLVGGGLFAFGLGALSKVVLNKTDVL